MKQELEQGNIYEIPIWEYTFEQLTQVDIVNRIPDLFKQGFFLNEHGVLDAQKRLEHNLTWIFVNKGSGRDCGKWKDVYFDHWHFIPKMCHSCWKVVIRPKTVYQLVELYKVMTQINHSGKLGVERRPFVFGNYGAYLYNWSHDEGQECYAKFYSAVAENHILMDLLFDLDPEGRTKNIILKRGCTEMERKVGPSTGWEYSEADHLNEEYLDDYVTPDDDSYRMQPFHLKAHVLLFWLAWAFERGDITYLNFTKGLPFYKPPVVYHPPV